MARTFRFSADQSAEVGSIYLFLRTVDASIGTYAKVKKIVWSRILVLHQVSTANLSSPEITWTRLNLRGTACSRFIQHPCYLLFNFRNIEFHGGKNTPVQTALETNYICKRYYDICEKERPAFTPTHWKWLQLIHHLRGWWVIVFVMVPLQVKLTSVQRLHRQSEATGTKIHQDFRQLGTWNVL